MDRVPHSAAAETLPGATNMQDAQITQDMQLRRTVDDEERLAILAQYGIDDGHWEPNYTRITRLIREQCDMNWAAVTFVVRDHQTFKARDGFDLQSTARHVSFCSVAMHLNQPLIIEDARRDSRFAHNPLVTSDPRIRFYAGFALVSSEGYPLGALCAMDMKPRTLFPSQMELLGLARDWVRASLELRRLVRTLQPAEHGSQALSPQDQGVVSFARSRAERAWDKIFQRSQCASWPRRDSRLPDPSRLSPALCRLDQGSQPSA